MNETKETVDIETIMQEVRQEILARKLPGQALQIGGKRFTPEFYEHLYQAGLVQSQLGVKLHVTESSLPLLGPLIDSLRTKLHQLFIFYINQLAEQQAEFNNHILRALNMLSHDLEDEQGAAES